MKLHKKKTINKKKISDCKKMKIFYYVLLLTAIFASSTYSQTKNIPENLLGKIVANSKKYPEKKVIIYSAETTGDRFDADLRKVDGSLPKNAEPIQFSNLIEDLCK